MYNHRSNPKLRMRKLSHKKLRNEDFSKIGNIRPKIWWCYFAPEIERKSPFSFVLWFICFHELWSIVLPSSWLFVFDCSSRNNALYKLTRSWALSMLNWCTVYVQSSLNLNTKQNTLPIDSKSRCTREDDECWLLVAKLVVGSWELSHLWAPSCELKWSLVSRSSSRVVRRWILFPRAIDISSDTWLANKFFPWWN